MTSRGFLARALVLSALFALAHAFGLREQMRFLSGTPAVPLLGFLYGSLYFSFVLLVPALVIGAALLPLLGRVFGRAKEEPRV
jgi:hypothetical protein